MRGEEVKPDKPIVRRYLGDANYPADLRELISEAGAMAPRRPSSSVLRTCRLTSSSPTPARSQRRWSAKTRATKSRPGRAEAASEVQQDGAAAANACRWEQDPML
jgi:hypothetical protein